MFSGKVVALLVASMLGPHWAGRPDAGQVAPFRGEIAFCPSGQLLAATRIDRSIDLYRKTPIGWAALQSISASNPRQLLWGRTGNALVWIDGSGHLAVWRHSRTVRLSGNNPLNSRHDIYSFALSPDESVLAVGRMDGLQLVHLGPMTSELYESGNPVTAVAFDEKGNLYAGGRSLLWLPCHASSIRRVGSVGGFVRGLAVSPNGRGLAVLEDDCQLALYSLASSGKHETVWRGRGHPQNIAWSWDGRLLAIVIAANEKIGEPNSLNRVAILKCLNWTEVGSIPLHTWATGKPEFDATGSTLGLTVYDGPPAGGTYIWSTLSWKPVKFALPH
jgi:WD40 repeat protein